MFYNTVWCDMASQLIKMLGDGAELGDTYRHDKQLLQDVF